MNILVILIPVALGLGGAGLVLFFWAMRDGQFEDLEGAANRILIDEEDRTAEGNEGKKDTRT
jgi:cbb3-type cytochrome oxidase maturation protein